MKKNFAIALVAVFAIGLLFIWSKRPSVWGSFKNPETEQMLKQFVALKEAQAKAATKELPLEFRTIFKYAERGNWLALSNSFNDLNERLWFLASTANGIARRPGVRGAIEDFVSETGAKFGRHWEPERPPPLRGTPGEAIKEVYGAFEGFVLGDEKYSAEFGREIMDSMPKGSVYFGGTDPGRFIITVMCQSQQDGDTAFVISPEPLRSVDGGMGYLQYLGGIYGKEIEVPTKADLEGCDNDFVRRLEENSKDFHDDLMGLAGPMIRMIADKNPGRELFIEQRFPITSLYPSLEPHGLIFKINRQPLAELSDDVVRRDHDYWCKCLEPKIGGWLTNGASIETIAAFAEKIFLRHDFKGFAGDERYVQNEYTCKMFSRERAAIGGLYAWRAEDTADPGEKKRMNEAAEFAFRQAWALCPYSSEAVYQYINLLANQARWSDALLVAKTAARMPANIGPDGDAMRYVIEKLTKAQAGQ